MIGGCRSDDRPDNVVLFVGDGLGVSSLSTLETILEREGRQLAIESLPVVGLVKTNTIGLRVSESASSATALATGFKTTRRSVSVSPDGQVLKTILEAARDQGFATGVITTTRLTDATPAAFASHELTRDNHHSIARQLVGSRVDFLAGGHGMVFGDSLRAAAVAKGYSVLTTSEELNRADSLPVLALFDERTPGTEAYGPPLRDVTAAAIRLLSATSKRVFLVVEQEETDTGAHKNDLPRVIDGIIELDEALQLALQFARQDGRTLVLLTADHDTGGYSETEDDFALRWLTRAHTNQWVPVLSAGPGSSHLTGILDNTDIPRILSKLLELEGFPVAE